MITDDSREAQLGGPFDAVLTSPPYPGLIDYHEQHRYAYELLGLDEDDFLRKTQGSFKLGIEFVDWGALGERYIHGFGSIGRPYGPLSCYHYWLRRELSGRHTPLSDYSINTAACRQQCLRLQQRYRRHTPRRIRLH